MGGHTHVGLYAIHVGNARIPEDPVSGIRKHLVSARVLGLLASMAAVVQFDDGLHCERGIANDEIGNLAIKGVSCRHRLCGEERAESNLRHDDQMGQRLNEARVHLLLVRREWALSSRPLSVSVRRAFADDDGSKHNEYQRGDGKEKDDCFHGGVLRHNRVYPSGFSQDVKRGAGTALSAPLSSRTTPLQTACRPGPEPFLMRAENIIRGA